MAVLAIIFSLLVTLVIVDGDCSPNYAYSSAVVASKLRSPVALAFSKQFEFGSFLVAEQVGVIWYYEKSGLRKVALNLTSEVITSERPMDERGLLGMTLDPHFSENGNIYIFYSAKSFQSGFDHDSVVARFSSHLGSYKFPTFDPASKITILRIPQPGPRQNGGQIFFGPTDGQLYISTGDGGSRNGSRFDKSSLLGKILRLNVTNGISMPVDNPFIEDESSRAEIFAYGFRNPWRCSVDKLWIICGDVGEPGRNEDDLNVILKGRLYGWLDHPNTSCSSLESCRNIASGLPANSHLPVYSYSHAKGQAVVGGIVYRGNRFPKLNGLYIFADYIHGSFHTLTLNSEDSWVKSEDLCIFLPTNDKSESMHVNGIYEGLDGEIYILANSGMVNSMETGMVYVLISSSCNSATSVGPYFSVLSLLTWIWTFLI